MKPNNYRIDQWNELMSYFGGYVKLERPIRFNLNPHSPTVKIYELKSTDNFAEYGEIRDAIIQRLKWLKHLNEKQNNPSL